MKYFNVFQIFKQVAIYSSQINLTLLGVRIFTEISFRQLQLGNQQDSTALTVIKFLPRKCYQLTFRRPSGVMPAVLHRVIFFIFLFSSFFFSLLLLCYKELPLAKVFFSADDGDQYCRREWRFPPHLATGIPFCH